MDARDAKKKVGAAVVGTTVVTATGAKGVLGRVRAAIADSAWGALAGKGVLAVAGFVVLAMVGSGRIGGASPRIGIPEAAAAMTMPSASASAGTKAAPVPSSSASASTSASTSTST